MRRLALLSLLALLPAGPAIGQNLTGRYVYQSPQGPVFLELQHTGTQVTGTLAGADGSVNRLEGTFDGQKAIGSIAVSGGTGWFAAGYLGDGLTLLVADLNPSTGEPNLDDGWRLDFTRADVAAGQAVPAAGRAGGGMSGATMPPAASPQVAQPPSANSPLVHEWMQHLRGKKVTYLDSYSSSDASGYGGYSNRWEAYLCSDGTFHFRSSSSMSADVGGVFGGGSDADSFSGAWRIVEQGGQAILQYQRSELVGTEQGEWVALGYRNGETYFDGERVYVTADNTVCP